MPGLAPSNPVIIGEAVDDQQARRVRVVMALDGLRPMQAAWVAGDGVDAALEDGSIVHLGKQPQRGRLWRVGSSTYHDKTIAERVAATTGQIAVEVA